MSPPGRQQAQRPPRYTTSTTYPTTFTPPRPKQMANYVVYIYVCTTAQGFNISQDKMTQTKPMVNNIKLRTGKKSLSVSHRWQFFFSFVTFPNRASICPSLSLPPSSENWTCYSSTATETTKKNKLQDLRIKVSKVSFFLLFINFTSIHLTDTFRLYHTSKGCGAWINIFLVLILKERERIFCFVSRNNQIFIISKSFRGEKNRSYLLPWEREREILEVGALISRQWAVSVHSLTWQARQIDVTTVNYAGEVLNVPLADVSGGISRVYREVDKCLFIAATRVF